MSAKSDTTAHTPGPWEWLIHDHSVASLGVGENPGMGDPLVLEVSPCPACANRANPKVWSWGRCCTPSKADADLIAAAPDLLAALEAVMSVADRKTREFDQAHAAIAKAKGVQNLRI